MVSAFKHYVFSETEHWKNPINFFSGYCLLFSFIIILVIFYVIIYLISVITNQLIHHVITRGIDITLI